MIINFQDWCAEKNLDLGELKEQPKSDKPTNEQGARTGAKEGLYPPQYWAGQYPADYKTPFAADSAYYQSINKKKK